MSRRITTDILHEAAIDYFTRYRFGVFREIGVVQWGRLKCDLLAVNLKGEIVGVEVKSSIEDFRTDKKWPRYLPHCNRFYFVFSTACWRQHIGVLSKALKAEGAGALVLCPTTGYLRVALRATRREMEMEVRLNMISRLAWRAATHSKRNRPRRTRRFIEIDDTIVGDAPCPPGSATQKSAASAKPPTKRRLRAATAKRRRTKRNSAA